MKPSHSTLLTLTMLYSCSICMTAAADDIFDDRYYVAPVGAYGLTPNSEHLENAYGAGVAFGKSFVQHLALEADIGYLYYAGGKDTTICNAGLLGTTCTEQDVPNSRKTFGLGLGGNLYLSPSNRWAFLHADAQGGNRLAYNGGLGVDVPIFGKGPSLRAEALWHKEKDLSAEPLFQLGFRIPVGELPEPAAPPPDAPVAVVPVEAPAPEAAPPIPTPAQPPCQPPSPGAPISLEGCKTGDTIVLRGVNFDFNKATLTVNAKTLLDQVADALLVRKDIRVEIDGHTDGVGGVAYNTKLSEERAKAVKNYLVERGIEVDRLASKGFGKSMPIADNKTEEGRELNRRVELKVTESGLGSVSSPTAGGSPSERATPSGEEAVSDSGKGPGPAAEPSAAVPEPSATESESGAASVEPSSPTAGSEGSSSAHADAADSASPEASTAPEPEPAPATDSGASSGAGPKSLSVNSTIC